MSTKHVSSYVFLYINVLATFHMHINVKTRRRISLCLNSLFLIDMQNTLSCSMPCSIIYYCTFCILYLIVCWHTDLPPDTGWVSYVPPAVGQLSDTVVDSHTAPPLTQVLLCHLHPAQRSHRKRLEEHTRCYVTLEDAQCSFDPVSSSTSIIKWLFELRCLYHLYQFQ